MANSGAAAAQRSFAEGVLQLHSFEYAAARSAFRAVERLDADFALAYWGEAMTWNHPLWGEQDLEAARAVLTRYDARAGVPGRRPPTKREHRYLEAAKLLFGAGTKAERDRQFCAAMAALAHDYPQDLEARSFYALALLAESGGKRNLRNYMRAAAEAEAVLAIAPRHPGALHYAIHAYDDPVHAPLGLRAARLYGEVAPRSEHAQHMPSHIYFALGLWDEAIRANASSVHVSHASGEPGYHALGWLEYADLQVGHYDDAAAIVRGLEKRAADPADPEARLRLAYARALWLSDAAERPELAADVDVDGSGLVAVAALCALDFVRGLDAIRRGDVAAAHARLDALEHRLAMADNAGHEVTTHWFGRSSDADRTQGKALALALRGAVSFHEGRHADGIADVRASIAHASTLEFEYGPPWSAKPLEELLGELLHADGRRAEAADSIRAELATYPNRRQGRELLARIMSTVTPSGGAASTRSARDLVGVWQLQDIELVDAQGHTQPDPFYGPHPGGLLIYDASGWFSVQIASARPAGLSLPAGRIGARAAPATVQDALAVLDTYYAYYGRWEFDPATGNVTHHVEHNLLPEQGTWVQQAEVQGSRMIFTRAETLAGAPVQQRKIWVRLD